MNNVHLIDAQTFNEHTILRIPSPPTYPLSSLSQSPPIIRTTGPVFSASSIYSPPSSSSTTRPHPHPHTFPIPMPVPGHTHTHAFSRLGVEPLPASSPAWCSPTTSPTTSSQRHDWPNNTNNNNATGTGSSTIVPSVRDMADADSDDDDDEGRNIDGGRRRQQQQQQQQANRQQQQQGPPLLFADMRNVSTSDLNAWRTPQASGSCLMDHRMPPSARGNGYTGGIANGSGSGSGYTATGLSGAVYEFMPPPVSASIHAYERRARDRNILEEDEDDEDEEEEDKQGSGMGAERETIAATMSAAARMLQQHPFMNLELYTQTQTPFGMNTNTNASTRAPLPHPHHQHHHRPTPTPSSSHSSANSNSNSNSTSTPRNIHITSHPATRTRSTYDLKNSSVHLSGMCFDSTGRSMYVGTERSIARWDVLSLLNKDSVGGGVGVGTRWGMEVFDEGGEWA